MIKYISEQGKLTQWQRSVAGNVPDAWKMTLKGFRDHQKAITARLNDPVNNPLPSYKDFLY